MTSIIRKARNYISVKNSRTILPAQKEINNAVSPHLGDENNSSEMFLLLMRSDTFNLTRVLSVPFDLTDAEMEQVASLVIKRLNEKNFFQKLKADTEIYNKLLSIMKKRGFDHPFPAYEFELSSNAHDIPVVFPDYTRVIKLEGERLMNIPRSLEILDLYLTQLPPAVMAEIGKARHLRELIFAYDGGETINLKGLPLFLTRLAFVADMNFEEGYEYDCRNLYNLHVPNVIDLPDEFVDSIAHSLRVLYIDSNFEGLGDFLKQIVNLEELEANYADDFDLSALTPQIKKLYIETNFIISGEISLLPVLRDLSIQANPELERLLEKTPNVEKLFINDWEANMRLTRVYPQVKNLSIWENADSQLNTISVLRVFPNLRVYSRSSGSNYRHRLREVSDYQTSSLEIQLGTFAQQGLLSYRETPFKRYTFDFENYRQKKIDPYRYDHREFIDDLIFVIGLSPETEEINFIVEKTKQRRLVSDILDVIGCKQEVRSLIFRYEALKIWLDIQFSDMEYKQLIYVF
jgi:hypothetical protein